MLNTVIVEHLAHRRQNAARDWMSMSHEQLETAVGQMMASESYANVVMSANTAINFAILGRAAFDGNRVPAVCSVVGRPIDMGDQDPAHQIARHIGKLDLLLHAEFASLLPSELYSREDAEVSIRYAVRVISALAKEVSPELDFEQLARPAKPQAPSPYSQEQA